MKIGWLTGWSLYRALHIFIARSSADLGGAVPPHHWAQNAPESSERFLQHDWQAESLAGHFFRQSSSQLSSLAAEVVLGRALGLDVCALTKAGNKAVVTSSTTAIQERFCIVASLSQTETRM